jgi:SNF2 family DNA or RNA helicase
MIQRGNRIHRVDGDTSRRYRVINLTIAKTLEEGILASIGIKADLADAILGEQGTRVSTTGRSPRKILLDAISATQ